MVTVYAEGDGKFVEPNELAQLIESKQGDLAAALGYDIISVESNRATEAPVVTTVTRSIPDWAVALIVIVNSVIVISLLLIVLAILWRRYTRYVDITMSHNSTAQTLTLECLFKALSK